MSAFESTNFRAQVLEYDCSTKPLSGGRWSSELANRNCLLMSRRSVCLHNTRSTRWVSLYLFLCVTERQSFLMHITQSFIRSVYDSTGGTAVFCWFVFSSPVLFTVESKSIQICGLIVHLAFPLVEIVESTLVNYVNINAVGECTRRYSSTV